MYCKPTFFSWKGVSLIKQNRIYLEKLEILKKCVTESQTQRKKRALQKNDKIYVQKGSKSYNFKNKW